MKYETWFDGEWAVPTMRNFRMACCDCSLVHRMNFKVDRYKQVHVQVFRDERATAAMRAAKKRKKKKKAY